VRKIVIKCALAALSLSLIAAGPAMPANCIDCSFAGRNLRGADLSGVKYVGVDFVGADLYGAGFRGAELAGADFKGADLRGADFTKARLAGVNFRGAKLCSDDERARFGVESGGPLRYADDVVVCADFQGADVYGADLRGALVCRDGPPAQSCEPVDPATLRYRSNSKLAGAILR
jgi:uncharacterized protein YjbI with pentapeptide repeats